MKENTDLYERITHKIVSDMEQGKLTWRKPWQSGSPVSFPLRWNNIAYSGINVIVLWATATEKGYTSSYWMTFKQATALNGKVQKGEKGTGIVYADHFMKEEDNPDGSLELKQIPFLKHYVVFNACQIAGLPDYYYSSGSKSVNSPVITNNSVISAHEPIEEVEDFFAQTKATILTGQEASYSLSKDYITMPPVANFYRITDYYATLAHELTHWTAHPKRMNRVFTQKFGDENYAKEELIAELGACFLAAELGFEPTPETRHTAYIQSWLTLLKNDKRLIFAAASQAQKATAYLWQLQEGATLQI